MTFIAMKPTHELVSGADIAEATGIPPHYISKVLRRLVVAGLLLSTRGRTGGFRLALPPECIRFLDILLATDFKPDTNHCAFGWPRCDPDHPCPLHPAYSELKRLFLKWAASVTLADVLEDPTALERFTSRTSEPM